MLSSVIHVMFKDHFAKNIKLNVSKQFQGRNVHMVKE